MRCVELSNIPKIKTDRARNVKSDDLTCCERANSLAYESKLIQSVSNIGVLHRKTRFVYVCVKPWKVQ